MKSAFSCIHPVLAAAVAVTAMAHLASPTAEAAVWNVAYTQTVSSGNGFRTIEGLALNSAGTSVYAGYVNQNNSAAITGYTVSGTTPAAVQSSTFKVADLHGGNDADPTAIAVDDRGFVLGATAKSSTSPQLSLFTSSLGIRKSLALSSTPGDIGGVDFRLSGTTRHVYVTRTSSGAAVIERYVLSGTAANLSDAALTLDTTFDGDGKFSISGANSLGGIDVAGDLIYVASYANDKVYRIGADLSVASTTVNDARDLAAFNGNVYVTQYSGSSSKVVALNGTSLAAVETFTVSGVTPARGSSGGYAGIDINSQGQAFISDQSFANNADRILVITAIPEPAAVGAIAGLAAIGLLRRRRA